ncbi:hypothetical protein CXY01_40740 [Cellulomonas xylanilytica]|uniref:Uncharacterized protein n=1 Tax=Cellulomonas xylanilytica TaxID=233583 RepID=A0A510V9K1_9CELL|nr:hypothetical protein CXY01_40740 [Cellulomonas xylanilytica]
MSGIPAGQYTLRAAEVSGEHLYDAAFWDGTASTSQYVGFTVADGAALTGVDLVLADATGVRVLVTDEAGNPLPSIQYGMQVYRPEEDDWYGLQRGPNLTDETGHLWENTVVGSTYKLCVSDDYYQDDWYQPGVRHGDACVGGGTTYDDAATFTVTEQTRRQEVVVTLPVVGQSLRPVEPFVTGSTAVGGTLTAETGTWKPAGVALSYQWVTWVDNERVLLPAGTGATFTPTADLVGKSLNVEVTGTLAGYRTATMQAWAGEVGTTAPTISQPLTLAGTAAVGQTLTATYGTITPPDDYPMFQWLVDGFPVGWTTSEKTFTLTAEHIGTRITARMTSYGDGGGVLHTSATSAVVQSGVPLTAPTPTISGKATVGQVLTAVPGSWAPAPVTLKYQWYRSGTKITGATTGTYTLTTADQGKTLTVHVIGSKPGYATVDKASAKTAVVGGLLTAPTPTISGTVRVGQKLTATPGTWGPAPVTLAYQWYRAGTRITGATASTYTLTTADLGKTLTVHVIGSKTGYTTVDKASAKTAAVAGLLTTATPTVSGTLKVGSTLTAKPGTWGPAPVTLAYQWYRAGVAISGATSPTYKLVAADKGTGIKVKVTGTKTGYTTVARTSAQTATIG